MSGTQPPQANPPAAGGAADPSMEDILASIRRILSEDEPQPAAAASPPPAEPDPEPAEDSDVLVLDQSMEVADEPPPADPVARATDPFDEEPAAPGPPPAPPAIPPAAQSAIPPAASFGPEPAPMRLSEPMDTELMAPETAEFATSAVSSLIRTLASERSTRVYSGGPTIEDLVREEIRPVLKLWLDTHLPDLVERLVRAEIERVVRRAVP